MSSAKIETKTQTPIETTTTTEVAAEVAAPNNSTSQEYDKQIRLLEDTIKSFRTRVSELKKMKKEIVTLEKTNDKLTKKKRKNNGNAGRKSGFTKPVAISGELSKLLQLEVGATVSRSEVTKLIGQYVREHQLSNPDNGREFLLNDSAESKNLENILDQTNKGDKPLGYFNLQRCIKHHFLKTDTPAVEAATASAVVVAPVVKKAKATTAAVKEAAPVEATKKVIKKKVIKKKKVAAA
jgi:chromatin remodeling complex protein RSC6